MSEKKRNSFGGSLGFVMAAAGSAVGLGNIWRFPYLAARDGGGLFLAVYIILALTFGFTLLTTEIAIGRKTKQSPLTAYSKIKKGWKALGVMGCVVPALIMPYYSAIGGWVLKYFIVFVTGHGTDAANDGYFTSFIAEINWPILFMVIFLVVCTVVILGGVNKGIENLSKILMPVLIVLVVCISVFCLFNKFTDSDGTTRTGLDGLKIYVVPSFEGLTLSKLFSTVMDAMGQLFFSLSVAMGIMITYGSYVDDDSNLVKSINQIEIFDTFVAFFAGAMIIPAVYTFMGSEGMESSGPGLMFITLPMVFASMGKVGNIIGTLFFAMVLLAAITSAISIMEAVVSSIMDQFHTTRAKATIVDFIFTLVVGVIVCLGYNLLKFTLILPNGSEAQVLDVLDYITNSILMPIISIFTCILIGWIVKPSTVIDEATKNGEKFGRKKLYIVMIKFIAPLLLAFLFIQSFGFLG